MSSTICIVFFALGLLKALFSKDFPHAILIMVGTNIGRLYMLQLIVTQLWTNGVHKRQVIR